MLPVLLYHFERSARGIQVLIAFLVSCALLMAMSWIVAFDPRLALKPEAEYGVPVKNYIDQSQEFALCAVVLAYPVITLLRAQRIRLAALLVAISLSFVVNMLFVSVSRTALVTMPIMLAVFALLHLKWRSIVIIACAAAVLARAGMGDIAAAAPDHRDLRAGLSTLQGTKHPDVDRPAAGILAKIAAVHFRGPADRPRHRIDPRAFRGGRRRPVRRRRRGGRKSAQPDPERRASSGARSGLSCYTRCGWCILLLFRGEGLATWIGLMVVVQNIFTSLFNSHCSISTRDGCTSWAWGSPAAWC